LAAIDRDYRFGACNLSKFKEDVKTAAKERAKKPAKHSLAAGFQLALNEIVPSRTI
jgi:hypothetical protein